MKRTKLFAALILVLLSAGSKASAEQTIPIEVIETSAGGIYYALFNL